jgi:hypothetical protein
MSVEVSEKELELELKLKRIESVINENIIEEIVRSKTLINDEQKYNYITTITSSIESLISAKNNVLYEIIKRNYNLYKQTIATILNYLDSYNDYIDDDITVLNRDYIKLVDEKQEYKLLYRKDDKNLYQQISNSVKLLDTKLNLKSFISLDSNVVKEITSLGSDIETSINYLENIRDNLDKLIGKLNIEGTISEFSEFFEIYNYSNTDRGKTIYLTLYYKYGSIYYDVKYNNVNKDTEFIEIKTLFQPSLIGRRTLAIQLVSKIFLILKENTNEWAEYYTPVVVTPVVTHVVANGGKKASSTYKLNGDKVSLLINKKKLHRSVYVRGNGKAKYCKINNEFVLLSKLKNKVIE